ncbi:MAG TPA: DUF4232 domain-containing protein [Jatrophihabitantaceae bacterium]
MRRRALLGGPAVALSLVLSVVVSGCASAHHDPGAGVRVVPWDGAVPAQLQVRTTAAAPPCRAAQLKVLGGGFQFAAALSGGTGTVTLRNAGPRACRLTGRPDVRVVGAVPAPRQRQLPLPAQPPEFPAVAPADTALEAVPPGGAVTLGVDWRNWCVPRTTRTPVPPKALRLTLPGGSGTLDAGYNAVPSCDTAGADSTVGVRPFQPAPLAATPPWSATFLQASVVSLSGSAPVTAARGDTARFAVQLHNPSTAPVSFPRCPLVVEMLAPAGRPEAHQLNCGAAGQIPAGGSLRFEMRILVPADAPTGANGLFWELDPTGSQGPEVVSRIAVAR